MEALQLNDQRKTEALQEFLSFRLGAEQYGIDILAVREIRAYERPTHIANTAEFIRGVINLRGAIVPIVDLRIKLGLPNPSYDGATVVIIINIANRMVGIVVDSVSDVVQLNANQIQPAPEFSAQVATSHILGIASLADSLLILIDIAGYMTAADMGLVAAAA